MKDSWWMSMLDEIQWGRTQVICLPKNKKVNLLPHVLLNPIAVISLLLWNTKWDNLKKLHSSKEGYFQGITTQILMCWSHKAIIAISSFYLHVSPSIRQSAHQSMSVDCKTKILHLIYAWIIPVLWTGSLKIFFFKAEK